MPSVICIFVLSVGKQNGPCKCGREHSNHINWVKQLLDILMILFIGYTQWRQYTLHYWQAVVDSHQLLLHCMPWCLKISAQAVQPRLNDVSWLGSDDLRPSRDVNSHVTLLFFCQVNNARLCRFPVSQISHKTWFCDVVNPFPIIFLKICP